MLLLLLKIWAVCTSLLAWIILSVAGISLLRHVRYDKRYILTIYILSVLWIMSSFHSWYEGFILFRKMVLVASVDSWAFTLLTPLLYFYFRLRILGCLPDKRQWILHLSVPTIGAVFYMEMSIFNTVSDKWIYNWEEFELNVAEWWVGFRIACYVVLIVQVTVYVPLLVRMFDKYKIQYIQFVKKEFLFVIFFYFISLISIFTPFYVCDILYNIFLVMIGGYIWKQSACYRIIKYKTGHFLLPYFFSTSARLSSKKMEIPILPPGKEKQLTELLKSPQLLHNPDLTIRMLAREFGMNATVLSHYFNQQLEIGFTEYVTALRLDEAEVLLKETDIKVVEISELVGFQTSSTFYQAFNTRHSLSPSRWRKKIKVNYSEIDS